MKTYFTMYYILFFLAIIGISDASYLTYEHFSNTIPPCSISVFADCGKVLTSSYATFFNIPISLFGVLYYLTVLLVSYLSFKNGQKKWKLMLFGLSSIGLIMSIYFVVLQLFIIKAICMYCMVSAVTSTSIFIITNYLIKNENLQKGDNLWKGIIKH